MKAMLFAAGLGTRLQPFTLSHPKALAVVNNQTLLQRNLTYLQQNGIDEVVINTHHFAEQIEKYLEENECFGMKIRLIFEKDILETGGGLLNAREYFTEDFVVMNADILTKFSLKKLIDFHQKYKPIASLAVSKRTSSRKLLFTEEMRLQGWRNLTTEEDIIVNPRLKLHEYAFSGIHILRSDIFDKITEEGKFSIMKSYMRLMKENYILGYDHTGDYLIDVGKPQSILEAEKYFR
ncbi:nucleotidyltransferase family protein [Weeksella virosa]|uniref:nucleotidyltransferase family protein n=1 Tax=Weeksella virosa TaxID=1014 RepID=UPI000E0E21E9|nr:sugar phosphate nucleotidyltransferase [Weeksella virosa]